MVRGTGSADPQEMLIFWDLLIFRIINVGFIFLVTRKRLTYHAAITDGIACSPLIYGVWNACETLECAWTDAFLIYVHLVQNLKFGTKVL